MKISLQIAFGYFLIVGLAAWFVLNVFSQEVKPVVRVAMEATLVDTANLLAEQVARDFKTGNIAHGALALSLQALKARPVDAAISGIHKRTLDYRVYITDANGIVVYATETEKIGQDYSQWRDVILTLRGEYGARTTRDDTEDVQSSVMHVAAPIMDGNKIVGVLTVAKPNSTMQPLIERSQKIIRERGFLLLLVAALIGIFFTWRLTRAIGRLRNYALTISQGGKALVPHSSAIELADLGRAIDTMREKLEDKQYVERYIHTLTHELKSPLAAIVGAAELLSEVDMPVTNRLHFIENIREQSARLAEITDKMLNLSHLEQMQKLDKTEPVDLELLMQHCISAFQSRLLAASVTVKLSTIGNSILNGDAFLLRQAVENLLDNALQFSPEGSVIEINLSQTGNMLRIELCDQGPGVPDYALPQVFERFFSLPRPATGKKSTGLGLSLVREVAILHGGEAGLGNLPLGGACAWITFKV